ncbi:cysteine-rich CPCC protein [Ralstonia sp. 121560039-2]
MWCQRSALGQKRPLDGLPKMDNNTTMNFDAQCECCDHFTLGAKGDWEICPVCFWEDDGFGLESLDLRSGANHGLTLREARDNFVRIGACCEAMRAKVLPSDARGLYRHVPRQP